MGITLNKKAKSVEEVQEKKVELSAVSFIVEESASMIDKLAELEKQFKDAEKVAKKAKEAFESALLELKVVVENSGLENKCDAVVAGEAFECSISAESTERAITDKEGLVAALEAVDDELPFKLANFKLTDLDTYLSKIEQEKFITKSYTGKRSFKFKAL